MSVKITPTEANSYMVNNIEVYQNSENNWLSRGELTMEEHSAFLNYIKPITEEKKSDFTKKHFDLEHLKHKLFKVEETINKIETQREILESRKDAFSSETLTLRNFYHKQLNKYHDMRNKIISHFPVKYKITQHQKI